MNYDQYTTLNFNLAQRLDLGRSGPQLSQGPQGPGLNYDLFVIHNENDPYGEAEAWLEAARPQGSEPAPGLALVFGLGLGYHLKILRRRYPSIRLVAFEPIPDMKDVYDRNRVLTEDDGPPPLILTDWSEFMKQVGRDLVYGQQSGVVTLAPEGYKGLRPEAFGTFNLFTRQEIMRRSVIERTRENSDAAFLKNLAENAGRLPDLPDLLLLKGRLPARPAFLVGSGPSLDQNADQLRQVGDKGLILAPASALKPLLGHRVRPDVVLALESEDTSDYLRLSPAEREMLGPNVLLALASSCHPAHFEVEGFHQAVFHLTAGQAQIFSRGVFLPQGGNSGSAVFSLAYVWGLAPLALVAQDQAYAGGRLHAAGTPGEVHESNPDTFPVQGVNDSVVETNTGLLASIGWYAEAARTIASQDSPPQLFNCSAGGARVPGFSEAPLSALVASLPPVSSRLDLVGVLPKLPRTSREEVVSDVAQAAGLVSALRRLAKMDYRQAYSEIKEIGAVSKFLAQVLVEAAVATDREDLIAALDRADGLMSAMATSLNSF